MPGLDTLIPLACWHPEARYAYLPLAVLPLADLLQLQVAS
jgi:hypothetical protein